MSRGLTITRHEMADVMNDICSADVTERHGHNWRRLNMVVAEHGDDESSATFSDFHMLEYALSGQQVIHDYESDLEHGNEQTSTLLPGMLNYFQAKTSFAQTTRGTARIQQIYIDDSVFHEAAVAMTKGDPDNVASLGFRGISEPRLQHIALELMREARHPSAGGELYAETLAQQIAILIVRRRLGNDTKPLFDGGLSDAELARIVDHIEDNLINPGGLDTLASLVDLDVYSYCRAFKKSTGQTPHQYLIGRRVLSARERLAHSSDRIMDIALDCGFSSQTHMTSTFKKYVGVAPGAYRRTCGSNARKTMPELVLDGEVS